MLLDHEPKPARNNNIDAIWSLPQMRPVLSKHGTQDIGEGKQFDFGIN